MEHKGIEDYTESEFLALVTDIFEANGSEAEIDALVGHFHNIVGHPAGAGLIVDPTIELEDDSPEGIVTEVKQWRTSQGLPCFKD
jgi:hypothetical protein